MKPQQGFRYVSPDGSFTVLGLQVFQGLERRLDALEGRFAAISAVVDPVGGATTDAEARAAIAAIIAGAA